VLTVNVDQQLGRPAEHLQRYRLTAQPGTAAPIAADHAPYQQFAVIGDGLLSEQVAQLTASAGNIDGRGDFGPLGTGAYHIGAGAAAGQQLQGIDNDGLAGAGLAGQHGQATAEFDFNAVDDREIADL